MISERWIKKLFTDHHSLITSALRFPWLLEGVEDEADHRQKDARVGDVEGGKWVREWEMQVEERKIDHMTMEETVGEISHHSGQE